MRGFSKYFGRKCAAAVAMAGLFAILPGLASAARYEVRMPVEKGPGMARQSVSATGEKPEGAAAPKMKSAKRRAAKASRKTQASSKKAVVKRAKRAEPKVEAAAKTEASVKAKAPPAKPAVRVKRVPATKSDKIAAASPHRDVKATQWPSGPVAEPRMALPAAGQWVGAVRLEFEENAVVLRAATNGDAERISWFNVMSQDGPRKLAIDIHGAWRKKGATTLRCAAGPVRAVVAGMHEDRLRLAVEFRKGAVEPDLEPKIGHDAHGVSVRIPLAAPLVRGGVAKGK